MPTYCFIPFQRIHVLRHGVVVELTNIGAVIIVAETGKTNRLLNENEWFTRTVFS